ncbi:MAG: NAD(P)H-dependent oxidoreductase subunit E [Candidatus Stygibacter frigidus]|nr:NAD(P)H-dependent oxidoreductase subunit E [Candidatus Stygibacter frigidus]
MLYKRIDVLLCCGSGCVSAGANKIKQKLILEIAFQDISEEINIIETGCMGPCDAGPVMLVYPEGVFYQKLTVEDIPELVEEHFKKGRPVKRLMLQDKENIYETKKDLPFYKKQIKVALENCGHIDPDSVDEYIATGGYEAIGKILTEMKPADAVQVVKESGLRGRGGGGFPTCSSGNLLPK